MDYTTSDANVVHSPSGHRMHQETAAVPTAVSAADMNMVIWSLMELLNEAAITPVAFDPATPATYRKLLQAVQKIAGGAATELLAELRFGGASTGITYAGRQGRKLLSGELVVFQAGVLLSNKGTATGAARLVLPGLPAPAGNTPILVSTDLMGSIAAPLSGLLIGGTNELELREYNPAAGSYATPATHALFTNSSVVYVSGSYVKAP
jgi:hypothetical protein